MSKYTVEVTITAHCTYTVELEARDESSAEREAEGRWRELLPEDFQVEKGYISDFSTETEQLTAECPECGEEHVVPHDDLHVCHCGQFGHNPYPEAGNKQPPMRPHLLVDGVCTPEPWWHEDKDYCAACGAKQEAEYKAAFGNE